MDVHVETDTNGYVTAVWVGKWPPEGSLKVVTAAEYAEAEDVTGLVILDSYDEPDDLHKAQLVGTDLVFRPAAPEPVRTAEGVSVSGCPEGTVIRVVDLENNETLAEITATGADLTLQDAGRYRIEVSPPLPWLPARKTVEVQA